MLKIVKKTFKGPFKKTHKSKKFQKYKTLKKYNAKPRKILNSSKPQKIHLIRDLSIKRLSSAHRRPRRPRWPPTAHRTPPEPRGAPLRRRPTRPSRRCTRPGAWRAPDWTRSGTASTRLWWTGDSFALLRWSSRARRKCVRRLIIFGWILALVLWVHFIKI